jgi:hypothetical protein
MASFSSEIFGLISKKEQTQFRGYYPTAAATLLRKKELLF